MTTDFFTFNATEVSGAVVIFNIIFASAACFAIALVYKKTHSGLSYSHSFFATIVLIGVIASVILMVIQHNIFGALGLLGAFALIRFRTIIKETRDIAFVFFSLVEGMAVGLSQYAVVLISVPMISLLAYALARFNFGAPTKNKYILMLSADSPIDEGPMYKSFRDKKMNLDLLNSKRLREGLFEYVFSVYAKDMSAANTVLEQLAKIHPSIKNYELISGRDAAEY